jgi:maltooligosyltrehalose synthase
MKVIKSYNKFKESLVIDLMMSSVDILESMNIWHDVLLSAISAEQKDMFDTLKLPKDFYQGRLTLDFLSDNIEFVNSLSSLGLKKSPVQNTEEYQTFVNKPCKWMFIYGIESNELENPIYITFQTWNETLKQWDDVKLFKINDDIKKFYDKLASKTIEVMDGDENFIYVTSNGNDWELQNLDSANDTYKRFFRKEELQSLLNNKNVKVSII